jgi:hypothetical protein
MQFPTRTLIEFQSLHQSLASGNDFNEASSAVHPRSVCIQKVLPENMHDLPALLPGDEAEGFSCHEACLT